MRTDIICDYELVRENPDGQLPPRSVLARLQPIGLGTPFRESLISYFQRLAHLHHVSPQNLARFIIYPLQSGYNEQVSPKYKDDLRNSYINGIGSTAEKWTKSLVQLTGQLGLEDLTLVPLRPFLNSWQLMATQKKWCPLCLSEAINEGMPYGQLLWEINVVNACPQHGIKLVTQCGCDNTSIQSPLNMKHLPWICKLCGRSLAQNNALTLEYASKEEMEYSRLVAELLEDLNLVRDESECIPTFLEAAVRHFTQGNAAKFARILGIRKHNLHLWLHGRNKPSFLQLINIARVCKCSVRQVLLGVQDQFKEIMEECTSSMHPSSRKNVWKGLTRDFVRTQLEILAVQDPPLTVIQAAKIIGTSDRYLRMNFCDITKKMIVRWRTHFMNVRNQRYEFSCMAYRESAENIARQGRIPTRRLVWVDIAGTSVLKPRKKIEKVACDRICREVAVTEFMMNKTK